MPTPPALPAAPARSGEPPEEIQAPPVSDETGGMSTMTILILVVVRIVVLLGIGLVDQGVRVRK